MNPYPSRLGASLAINLKSLLSFAFGWSGWALWPHTAEWWGLGVLCVLNGVSAAWLAGSAFKIMARVHGRDKAIRLYMMQGRAPKTTEIASADQLERAGMR